MTTSFNYNFFSTDFLFAPILLAGAVIRFYTVCAVLMIDSKGGMHQSCGFYLPQVSSVKFLETTKYIIDEKQYLTVLVGVGVVEPLPLIIVYWVSFNSPVTGDMFADMLPTPSKL